MKPDPKKIRRRYARLRRRKDRAILRCIIGVAGPVFILFLGAYSSLRFGLFPWFGDGAQLIRHAWVGDALGPFASVFSFLALMFALYSVALQRSELHLQREEMRMQREIFSKQAQELETSAKVQQLQLKALSESARAARAQAIAFEAAGVEEFLVGAAEAQRVLRAYLGAVERGRSWERANDLSREFQEPSTPHYCTHVSLYDGALLTIQTQVMCHHELSRCRSLHISTGGEMDPPSERIQSAKEGMAERNRILEATSLALDDTDTRIIEMRSAAREWFVLAVQSGD